MNRKFNRYAFQNWMQSAKAISRQLIIPFTTFQTIRTFLFPSPFDVLLLAIFIAIALAFHYEWS